MGTESVRRFGVAVATPAVLAIALVSVLGSLGRGSDPTSSRPPATVAAQPPASTGTPEATPATTRSTPVLDVLPVAADHERPVVVLYGDSLAWEARDHFVRALAAAGVDVRVRTFGGTALCDFLNPMRDDAVALRPDAVVVEFSGNALTPCMRGRDLLDAYRADAEAVFGVFPTARVYFVGAPISRADAASGDFNGGAINDVYGSVAAGYLNGRYVDAGAAVLDGGRWTLTLPCLPDEPCTGAGGNVVRAPDGAHFCPIAAVAQEGVVGSCSVWSSGAYRYGSAMAGAVVADLPS